MTTATHKNVRALDSKINAYVTFIYITWLKLRTPNTNFENFASWPKNSSEGWKFKLSFNERPGKCAHAGACHGVTCSKNCGKCAFAHQSYIKKWTVQKVILVLTAAKPEKQTHGHSQTVSAGLLPWRGCPWFVGVAYRVRKMQFLGNRSNTSNISPDR